MSTQSMMEKLRKEGRDEARHEGQVLHARAVIRRVLAARKLVPSRSEEAQLDACADLATLERWHELALTAPTVADALHVAPPKAPARARRSTPSKPRKSRSAT